MCGGQEISLGQSAAAEDSLKPPLLYVSPNPTFHTVEVQTVCKPGSVPAAPKQRRWMAIHLGRPLPGASSRPTRTAARKPACGLAPACRPYSVLLPVGFTLPSTLPPMRCALTAPFHPCRVRRGGGLLSVALSLGLPPPAVNRHRVPVEPGLSSPRRVSPLPGGGHPTV